MGVGLLGLKKGHVFLIERIEKLESENLAASRYGERRTFVV